MNAPVRYRVGPDPFARWLGRPMIRGFGVKHHRTPRGLAAHTHPAFELTWCIRGEVAWELRGGTRLHLHGGEMGLTQPDVVHRGELEIIAPSQLLWVIFDPRRERSGGMPPEETKRLVDMCTRAGNGVVAASEEVKHYAPRLRELHGRYARGETGELERSRAGALLQGLIVEAAICFRDHRTPAISGPVREALWIIDRDPAAAISARELARRTELGPSWFFELFSREVGQSPAQYRMRRRIERARELLREPGRSITSVALDLGFSSSQHFSSSFRRFTGMTPGKWRLRK